MIYSAVPLLLPLLRGNTLTRFQTAAGPLPVHSEQVLGSFVIGSIKVLLFLHFSQFFQSPRCRQRNRFQIFQKVKKGVHINISNNNKIQHGLLKTTKFSIAILIFALKIKGTIAEKRFSLPFVNNQVKFF